MLYEDKISLSKVRLQTATSCLEDSRALIESGGYKSAVNRSYYAVFHAMRAVLALDSFDSKKHSGIISEFRKNYIKTQIFDDDMSRIIGDQFDARSHSDYDDFYVISKDFAVNQLEEAETAVGKIEKYLTEIYSNAPNQAE
ncbi:MAG: HEPN domain-containing protein [Acutalibacteraceae bacterium]